MNEYFVNIIDRHFVNIIDSKIYNNMELLVWYFYF